MCPSSGFSLPEPEPNIFSFNSPYGACNKCNGLGEVTEVDINKILPDTNLSVKKGGIAPLGKFQENWIFKQVEVILINAGHNLTTPLKDISEEILNRLLYGTDELIKIVGNSGVHEVVSNFEGIINFVTRHQKDQGSKGIQRWADSFTNKIKCSACNGTRLKEDSLLYKVNGTPISELTKMDLSDLAKWNNSLEEYLSDNQWIIAKEIVKEIKDRIQFLLNVGLNYLSLNLSARTLSGGEAQRIRLATQIGSELTGVLYILDEPSIGLHQRDNHRLIESLIKLRESGNSVIVVEHDKDIMLQADHLIDIGPGAGINGGHIVSQGPPSELDKANSTTADYILGKKEIVVPKKRRKSSGKNLLLKGASGHNLKNVNFSLMISFFF